MSELKEVSPARRRTITISFIVLMVGAGFLNGVVKRHDLGGSSGVTAATSSITMSSQAISTAWYCPGPLALDHRGEGSSVEITNVARTRVNAQIHVATNIGATFDISSVVAGLTTKVMEIPRTHTPTYGALTVVINGGGAGVNERLVTPNGTTVSPCSTHTTTHADLGAGSTTGLSNVAVSLYNPGATPAVANLGFLSGGSLSSPAAFSSVPIEPGQDVVLFAGHALPQRAQLSPVVTTVSGQIVVGDLNLRDLDNSLHSSLTVASPIAARAWSFAPVVVARALHQLFYILNPNPANERVSLALLGDGANGATTISVPGETAGLYEAPSPLRAGIEAATITVLGTGTIISEREVSTTHRVALGGVERGSRLPATLPRGFAITGASGVPVTRWLLAGGDVTSTASEILGFENPNSVAIHVTITELVNGRALALRGLAPVTVAPHTSIGLDLGAYLASSSSIAIEVIASRPFYAGITSYGRGTSGISAPAPLPIG